MLQRLLAAALAAGACLWAAAAPAQQVPGASSPDELEQVVVTGRQPGPKMWVLADGDSEVWILGVNPFLPKDVQWDASRVTAVLSRSDVLVAPPEVKLSPFRALGALLTKQNLFFLPKKQRLADVLPAPSYARFAAARTNLGLKDTDYERLRPAFAAGILLGKAIDRAGLDGGRSPGDKVLKLARKQGVAVQPLRTFKGKEAIQALGQVSDAAQLACFDALLAVVERGTPVLKAYANAWAIGDVAFMRGHPPPEEFKRCQQELFNSVDFARRARSEVLAGYFAEIDAGLARPATRLLVIDISDALSEDGLIASLRARGYTVEGP